MFYVNMAIIGLVAGFISGLLGVGGGIILVPALLLFAGTRIHQAIGVSLAAIVPTALIGAATHFRAGNVDLKLALLVAIGGVLGGFLGATAANFLPATALKKVFAVCLILIGISILFDWTSKLTMQDKLP